MKILELSNFSAGVCGVFARVLEESKRLSKKHEVRIFSSNLVKGKNQIAASKDKIDNVKIKRFPARKLGGESFMKWDFEDEAKKYKPDLIIAHSYRHFHTTKALKVAEEIGCKVFLVTHGPFVDESVDRGLKSSLAVNIYDKFFGPKTINKFDKIIAITYWEIPYLLKLGVREDKIEYIPNGIPKEFFSISKGKEENKILFLGRISPVKNLEVLIKAFNKIKNKKTILEIVGPAEDSYLADLNKLIIRLRLEERVRFSPAIFDMKKKIKKIDSSKVFILPSKTETMPQSLIEAMSREKIVIASNNRGSKELVKDSRNGYLFKIGNYESLARKIDFAMEKNSKSIRRDARKSVEKFNWEKVIKKLDSLIGSI